MCQSCAEPVQTVGPWVEGIEAEGPVRAPQLTRCALTWRYSQTKTSIPPWAPGSKAPLPPLPTHHQCACVL